MKLYLKLLTTAHLTSNWSLVTKTKFQLDAAIVKPGLLGFFFLHGDLVGSRQILCRLCLPNKILVLVFRENIIS